MSDVVVAVGTLALIGIAFVGFLRIDRWYDRKVRKGRVPWMDAHPRGAWIVATFAVCGFLLLLVLIAGRIDQ